MSEQQVKRGRDLRRGNYLLCTMFLLCQDVVLPITKIEDHLENDELLNVTVFRAEPGRPPMVGTYTTKTFHNNGVFIIPPLTQTLVHVDVDGLHQSTHTIGGIENLICFLRYMRSSIDSEPSGLSETIRRYFE